MKRLVLLLGFAACGGSSTTPTANGVFPAEGFAGRTVHVEISGDATNWTSSATVSFGAGATVANVTAASPTDLFCDVTLSPTAALGPVDVTVTSSGTFTLKQAFQIQSPVTMTFQGDASQGGLPNFTINDLDFDNQFDTTTDPDTGDFTNITITGPAGTAFTPLTVTAFQITGQVSIDGDAAPGTVTVSSGVATPVMSVAGNMAVVTRAPTPLTSGTASSGMIADIGDTGFFSLAAGAASPSLVHLAITTTDQDAEPGSIILPSSGHWAESLGGTFAVVQTAAPVDIVVADVGGVGGYSFMVTAVAETLTTAPEAAEQNDTVATATNQAGTVPFEQTGGTISGTNDAAVGITGGDWIKVIVPAGASRRLVISTSLGADPNTDTQVDLTNAAGTTSYLTEEAAELGVGPPIDGSNCSIFTCTSYGEDVVSDALAAGTYYLKITQGANYASSDAAYTALVYFQ